MVNVPEQMHENIVFRPCSLIGLCNNARKRTVSQPTIRKNVSSICSTTLSCCALEGCSLFRVLDIDDT